MGGVVRINVHSTEEVFATIYRRNSWVQRTPPAEVARHNVLP